MLRIDIPQSSALINKDMFVDYNIPKPPNGTNTEINEDVVLLFDDEEQAVAYLDKLEEHADDLDDESPGKDVITALITAITEDAFVQAFIDAGE
ncbi:hypothetical protein [Mucilaginibacter pedocola]|uniref:Uncharacterized protein n=1 Tax=Mucilaginibacter pedocola TaxID=1792845 RepID=A0A1S9PM99_9SPHI|nr:hypothetical protein [Mucilaginibacter pedocola]OOQ62074.1 hypothetical protein BC343_03215 [Mucilaginibacter pedocola]